MEMAISKQASKQASKHSPSLSGHPSVSVIIPARNAETTIRASLDSVLSQDYEDSIEVIVSDGSDHPATSEVVRHFFPSVMLISNPEQVTGAGINAALRVASGEVVVRCDAHTVLPQGYVRQAVATLRRTGAANVGGRQQPVATTFFEHAVAMTMTSLLGSGAARYRVGGAEGSVDTVFLGCFRRGALDAVGGYNSTFVRNQDYELNWRLRQQGQTVWFDPGLVVFYRPRGSFRALFRQYFDYGRWKSLVLRTHPSSLQVRQVIPPLLVLGLLGSATLFLVGLQWAAVLPLIYILSIVFGAVVLGFRHRDPAAVLVPLILATMHLSWGIGFLTPVPVKPLGMIGGGGVR